MRHIHLSVGKLSVDVIVRLERIPDEEENVNTDLLEVGPGGAATNYAVTASKLGDSVKLLAKVGEGELSTMVMRRLASMGVGLDYVEEVEGPQSAALIILGSDGKRRIVRRPGAGSSLKREEVEKLSGLFDVVHYASVPAGIVVRDHRSKLTTYDPGPLAQEAREFEVDVVFVNEAEWRKLGGGKFKSAVIKMGEKGATTTGELGECKVEALKVEPVDTTGAGDSFDAAFNYALTKGRSVEWSLQFASVVSGLKVTRVGGTSSPTMEEVLHLMARSPPRVKCT
ncbi:sugar kinase [Sulfodiicoccus acidiphilus]|uniref:Sugar kinase n=1 Tax=Sulfodiicoccus acidiphilus TaxID=1670455 RepID=A0A348B3L8_9CREN|nr:carbohydrate kinase family protein [Sulfodiicoccus acidiphilus]BBD72770.1 sugar kinase [Sulfodiicoccus acidiphilus]GGT99667.1 sugar kinase [Sulfodiicoccus acidiphilus]